MGGRPPKPSEYHELTKPKLYGVVKARVENTPKAVKPLVPRCPAYLPAAAKKEWRAIAKTLKNYNMFTIANQTLIDLLARNLMEYKQSVVEVSKTGIRIAAKNEGETKINPWWDVSNRIEKKILLNLKELGLSSLGLAKIGGFAAGALKNKTEMEKLLD